MDEQVWTKELLEAPHQAPDKAGRVRRMFDAIAPRYERINSLFSAGRDAVWRRRAVALSRVTAEDDVLDIACGTGDFARSFVAAGPRRVYACDFSHEMLRLARERGSRIGRDSDPSPSSEANVSRSAHSREAQFGIQWCEADALHLPWASGSFSITACAFGVRNFQDLSAGFAEMHRVLRPNGRAVILEFSRPRARVLRALFDLYSNRFMPAAASWLSGDRTGAYRYLPQSVRSFEGVESVREKLRGAGFTRCETWPLSLGIVTIYLAHRT